MISKFKNFLSKSSNPHQSTKQDEFKLKDISKLHLFATDSAALDNVQESHIQDSDIHLESMHQLFDVLQTTQDQYSNDLISYINQFISSLDSTQVNTDLLDNTTDQQFINNTCATVLSNILGRQLSRITDPKQKALASALYHVRIAKWLVKEDSNHTHLLLGLHLMDLGVQQLQSLCPSIAKEDYPVMSKADDMPNHPDMIADVHKLLTWDAESCVAKAITSFSDIQLSDVSSTGDMMVGKDFVPDLLMRGAFITSGLVAQGIDMLQSDGTGVKIQELLSELTNNYLSLTGHTSFSVAGFHGLMQELGRFLSGAYSIHENDTSMRLEFIFLIMYNFLQQIPDLLTETGDHDTQAQKLLVSLKSYLLLHAVVSKTTIEERNILQTILKYTKPFTREGRGMSQ